MIKFQPGDLIRVTRGIFEGQVGLNLEKVMKSDSFVWLLVNQEPQWVHIGDCELIRDNE